ncbi:hypothetical protein ACIHFE_33205 [Streptomyces sp. NPDC052396]|uniref:hypothetical protein n=1 Tax=Streptomyces sp. NPDC052396 TaxID=3365689 RepID=UPI0037D22C19
MNVRKSIAAAAATLALGAGVAVAAPAQAAQSSADSAQYQGWHLLWSGSHAQAKSWSTPDFVPDMNNLSVNFGCYGHDGEKIRAQVVRTSGRVAMTGWTGWVYCHDGEQQRLDVPRVRAGEAAYIRLQEQGPHLHSMYAKAYTYHY